MNKNNNLDDKKLKARKLRGQINSEDLKEFKGLKFNDLINVLSDKDPQKRTIAGTLLNEGIVESDNDKKYIIATLSKSLKGEKALYSRIAIMQSLASYGELAVPYLIELLGVIGNNQEKELPKKYFNKKSFPLPRDLAARTLSYMGNVAIPYLIEVLNDNISNSNNASNSNNNSNFNSNNASNFNNDISTHFKKEQALDAIGAIVYKYDDHRAYDSINNLFIKTVSSGNIYEESNKILIWKIVRSLSGFYYNEYALNLVIDILKRFDNVNEIQWEAIRSIGQIGIVNDEVKLIFEDFDNSVCNGSSNVNSQIKLALKVSKNSLCLF